MSKLSKESPSLPKMPYLGPIRVVIADPRLMTRDVVSSGLSRFRQFKVIASVGSLEQLMHALEKNQIDIALISVMNEDELFSGSSSLRRIRIAYTKIRLVVLIDCSDADLVVQAFRNGASGVFSRAESDFASLRKCVESVHDGKIWATNQHIKFLIDALSQPSHMRVVDSEGINMLSKREEDVVRLLAEGMSNREISQHLDLSEHTVKNYLFKIFDKLGVSSRTELVLYTLNCAKEELPHLEPGIKTEESTLSRVRLQDASVPSDASRMDTGKRIKPGRVHRKPERIAISSHTAIP